MGGGSPSDRVLVCGNAIGEGELSSRSYLELLPFVALVFILPFPGTVAFRLLCLSVAIGLTVWSWKKWTVPTIPCKVALSAWALLAAVSLLYAVDRQYSLGEIKNEIGYTMAAFFTFFAVTRSRQRLQIFGMVVLISALVISVWALWQRHRVGYWDDGARHGGVGSFASLAIICAPMGLIAWQGMRRTGRLVLLSGAVAVIWAVAVSEQRIVWLAYGVQLAILVCLLAYAGLARLRAGTVALIAACIMVISLTMLLAVHARKVDQSPVEYYDLGNDFRLQQWGKIAARIMDQPLVGAGFGRESMKKAYPDLVPADPPMSLMWHPHNVLLNYGVAMGVPGVVVLLLLLTGFAVTYGQQLRSANEQDRLIAAAGIILITGVVVRNMTNDLFLRDGALLFWALNGALLGYLMRQRKT